MAFSCKELKIPLGAKIGLAGETGSGKSTLLRIIGGLGKPDQGQVLYNNEDVYPKLDRLIAGHPDIAYLSQSFELPKFITVSEFLFVHPFDDEEVDEVVELCDINHLLENETRELSGGERQRVALAKTLLRKPEVLLLDEPYSNLDPPHKREMKRIIDQLDQVERMTILMVSHEPTDLLPWADEVLVLRNGGIYQTGAPKHIYQAPNDDYVAGLFGEYQLLKATDWGEEKERHILARPEDFSLSKNAHGGNGAVVERQYHGGYDLLVIQVGEEQIRVRSEVEAYQIGDQVRVSLSKIL